MKDTAGGPYLGTLSETSHKKLDSAAVSRQGPLGDTLGAWKRDEVSEVEGCAQAGLLRVPTSPQSSRSGPMSLSFAPF